MTEPPRPPGDPGTPPPEPTAPLTPYPGGGPTHGYQPPPGYPQPPADDATAPPPGYPPPGHQPPGYQPPGYQPPGYQPPGYQAPGYGPPPGYGQPPGPPPGYGPGAPAGYATSDDKTWAMLAHFGGLVLGFLAPLIVMLAKGNESPTVRAHAVEALNFQITWGVASLIGGILAACSFGILSPLPIITVLVLVIFAIIGGVKANDGQLYHYPATIRLVT